MTALFSSVSVFAQNSAKEFPYEAVIRCEFNGSHSNVVVCFMGSGASGTELELTNGDAYKMYKAYELQNNNVGTETREGFIIPLRKNFSLIAQNSSKSMTLNVVIRNTATKQKLFEKSASQYGVISVKN